MKVSKILILSLFLLCNYAFALDIEFFTATYLPKFNLYGETAEVYLIDKPDLIVGSFGRFHTGNANESQNHALRFLGSSKGKKALAELKHSSEGALKAWEHKIKYLPAVVINEKYVIYGVTDLREVKNIYYKMTGAVIE